MKSLQIVQKELKPLKDNDKDFEGIEKKIREIFRREIYLPILKILGRSEALNNSLFDLLTAIQTGRLQYYRGSFTGKFNASLSKELKDLGAKWDRKNSAWKITQSELPIEVRNAISSSIVNFESKLSAIDRKLSQILPAEIAEKVNIRDHFDRTIWKTDKEFRENVKNISIQPAISEEVRSRIAEEWQDNMDLWIKDWTQKTIGKLRKDVQASVFAGNRREAIVKIIRESHDVSINKAKFLARQETRLLLTKYKQARYEDAGVKKYRWGIANRPIQHAGQKAQKGMVRHDHARLAGKVFEWQTPPITNSETGARNNPGQDYNCFPGSTLISIDRPIDKLFRRRYSGELTLLIGDDGIILKSTRNHPILTRSGWKAAKDIDIGDYILNGMNKSAFSEKMNSENMITSFEKIFSSLGFCSEIFVDTLSESDFHNDVGMDKQVHVISIDRELMLDNMARLYQTFHNFSFEFTDPSLFPKSSFCQNEIINGLPTYSLMSFFSELKFLLLSHITHADIIRFRSRSSNYFGLFEPSGYDTATNPIFSSTLKLTDPTLITINSVLIKRHSIPSSIVTDSFSRVSDRSFEAFDGHIYNLQSSNGEYIAQNRIVHNCRCYAIPIVEFKVES